MNAGCDDGSCTFPGCTFAEACNYDTNAGCNDGSCVFAGCTDATALNYNPTAGCDNGSCFYSGTPGCTDMMACNYDAAATVDNFTCTYPGCSDATACNYDFNAGCDDSSCTYPGCTFANACNYEPAAGCNNGSCVFPGCTDPTACNFDFNAACDDGSCIIITTYVISGAQLPDAYTESNYSYPYTTGSTYIWSVSGGAVLQPSDTSEVTIAWAFAGIGQACVQEVNSAGCLGEITCIDIVIQPSDTTNVSMSNSDLIVLYPNPTLGCSALEMPETMIGSTMRIYNTSGALVYAERITARRTMINTAAWAAGVYSVVLADGQEHNLRLRMIKE
jgi:hypothetical protein